MTKIRIEKIKRQSEPMTFDEACAFFRVSRPTLLKAVRSGAVYARKINKTWRVWENFPGGLKSNEEQETIGDATKTAAVVR